MLCLKEVLKVGLGCGGGSEFRALGVESIFGAKGVWVEGFGCRICGGG